MGAVPDAHRHGRRSRERQRAASHETVSERPTVVGRSGLEPEILPIEQAIGKGISADVAPLSAPEKLAVRQARDQITPVVAKMVRPDFITRDCKASEAGLQGWRVRQVGGP